MHRAGGRGSALRGRRLAFGRPLEPQPARRRPRSWSASTTTSGAGPERRRSSARLGERRASGPARARRLPALCRRADAVADRRTARGRLIAPAGRPRRSPQALAACSRLAAAPRRCRPRTPAGSRPPRRRSSGRRALARHVGAHHDAGAAGPRPALNDAARQRRQDLVHRAGRGCAARRRARSPCWPSDIAAGRVDALRQLDCEPGLHRAGRPRFRERARAGRRRGSTPGSTPTRPARYATGTAAAARRSKAGATRAPSTARRPIIQPLVRPFYDAARVHAVLHEPPAATLTRPPRHRAGDLARGLGRGASTTRWTQALVRGFVADSAAATASRSRRRTAAGGRADGRRSRRLDGPVPPDPTDLGRALRQQSPGCRSCRSRSPS